MKKQFIQYCNFSNGEPDEIITVNINAIAAIRRKADSRRKHEIMLIGGGTVDIDEKYQKHLMSLIESESLAVETD